MADRRARGRQAVRQPVPARHRPGAVSLGLHGSGARLRFETHREPAAGREIAEDGARRLSRRFRPAAQESSLAGRTRG